MLSNLRFKGRILLGYAVPIALMAVAFIVIFMEVRELQSLMREASKSRDFLYAVKDLKYDLMKVQRSARGYVIYKSDVLKNIHLAAKKACSEIMERVEATITDEKMKSLFAELKKINGQLDGQTKRLMDFVDSGQPQKAVEEFRKGEGIKLGFEIENASIRIEEVETANQRQLEQRVTDVSAQVTIMIIAALIMASGISLFFGYWLTSKISYAITDSVSSLYSTSMQIASTLVQHERTAVNQATAVAETSATVEHLGVSAHQSLEQASSAAALAQKAVEFTKDGKLRVQEAVDGMAYLKQKVGAVGVNTLKLGEQINQINRIAEIVKDLSGQINMLALNAAVEAARAGEHGKGFAVVASEVRKLVDQSKKSAEQTNTIINEIRRSTNATIMSTEEGSKSVEDVIKLAKTVDALFDSLSSTADIVYQNAQQVMLNTRQQSAAVNQIIEAISAVNLGAKETATGITATKAGVARLNETAGVLKAMM